MPRRSQPRLGQRSKRWWHSGRSRGALGTGPKPTASVASWTKRITSSSRTRRKAPPGPYATSAGKSVIYAMADYIWGRYPVLEAMRSRRRVHRRLVGKGPRDEGMTQLLDQARRIGVPVETTSRRHLDDLTKGANHQGVLAVTAPRQYAEVDDILAHAQERGEDPLIVVLDTIQDVHNLGPLIRTAQAVGAHGIIIPEHRAAGLTPAVDKTSAGAVDFLPVARVTNLTRTLDELKKKGVWCIGLEGTAEQPFDIAHLTRPIPL